MPIEDLARSDVITASPDTSLAQLAEMMHDTGVGSIVVTEDEMPVGIVTDRDLAIRAFTSDADPYDMTAENVMSEKIRTIDQGDGFYQATDLMSQHGIRRLPVCDADGKLVGIITADDLSELIADEQQQLAEVIRAQRPPY